MSCMEHFFEDRDVMFEALAVRISERLAVAVEQKGEATFVVSGGSTPAPLFERLSMIDIPWEKITVTLADERWVPMSDKDSNEAMIMEKFLVGHAAKARMVGLYTGEPTPAEGMEACSQRLEQLPRPFDVVFLGMGNDGHTASLFPEGDNLLRALEAPEHIPCYAMNAPGAPQPRITLTLSTLLNCNDLLLICTGNQKLDVFRKAEQDGPVEELPIRAAIRSGQLSFYWAP